MSPMGVDTSLKWSLSAISLRANHYCRDTGELIVLSILEWLKRALHVTFYNFTTQCVQQSL